MVKGQARGPVLYAVAGLTFVMWTLVFERAWYFRFGLPADVRAMLAVWDSRPERRSWHARQVRRALISRLGRSIGRNLAQARVEFAGVLIHRLCGIDDPGRSAHLQVGQCCLHVEPGTPDHDRTPAFGDRSVDRRSRLARGGHGRQPGQ